MYAISTVDAKKLSSIVESLQQAFPTRAVPHAGPKPAPDAAATSPASIAAGTLDGIQAELEAKLAAAIATRRVEIERHQHALVVSIRELGSFAVGSTDLSADARDVLTTVGGTLAGYSNMVRVEGHTDDLPIHSPRFASNWELSTARATTVVLFFIEHAQLKPELLSATGYASYRPRVDNASDADRARNRRVDIVILAAGATAAD